LANTSSRSVEELIRACAENGSAEDWAEFVRRFHGPIAAVVIRMTSRWGSVSPALVDDLIQETYLKICGDRKRLLGEFKAQHADAFYGYLKVITTNVVNDHFRTQRSQKRGSGQTESFPDEESAHSTEKVTRPTEDVAHRDILLREVDQALCAVASSQDMKRDRIIFFLYYRYGLTASAIARLPSIALTVKGVESVIHRLTQLVRERLADRDSAFSGD
jgi:RNA polymerase sigma-70 factor, ECF subfamily